MHATGSNRKSVSDGGLRTVRPIAAEKSLDKSFPPLVKTAPNCPPLRKKLPFFDKKKKTLPFVGQNMLFFALKKALLWAKTALLLFFK